jgi:hypothetical protein
MARYRGEIEKSDEVTNFRASRISESTLPFWHKADITIAANDVRFEG